MFTVHLLRAPDYPPDDYFALCQLLHSLPMPGWTFQTTESERFAEDAPYYQNGRRRPEDVVFDYLSPVHKLMYDHRQGNPISWQELFDACQYYRRTYAIAEDDFVVLLTNRPNALNWFSSFDHSRHIFVHTDGWEVFMGSPHQFPVAYEVIANVLQSQMQLDTEGKDACLHEESIGCMNDFCQEKRQIAFKMRTADVCAECSERLHQCEVPDHLVEGATQGFEALRKQILFSLGFQRHAGPGMLEVTWLYEFRFPSLGNLLLKLTPMCRTLYAFFLLHPEGVKRADLIDHRDELLGIHGRISGRSQEEQTEAIDRLIHAQEGSYNENRSRIKKAIERALGERLAAPYLIGGEAGGIYGVEVERDRVKFLNG
ncbi:hypothetical protein [Persicitalea sp.]|uniref:hypothetical protein n=1 Tax=Persicitalea sp. TaxID=3100273 RepID=UPI0035937799